MQNSARWVLPVTIDQEDAQRTIDQPRASIGCSISLRSSVRARRRPSVPRFVDARRLDSSAPTNSSREQIRQRRMVLPVGDERAQQIGPAQERAVGGVGPPSMTWLPPPVPVWRPSSMNFSVPRRERRASSYSVTIVLLAAPPRRGRVDVDLDDAGIRRDLERAKRRIARRRVALDQHGHRKLGGGRLHGREQLREVRRASSSSGMNTYSLPSRGSTHSAVWGTPVQA